jgi:hypothetical protein
MKGRLTGGLAWFAFALTAGMAVATAVFGFVNDGTHVTESGSEDTVSGAGD